MLIQVNAFGETLENVSRCLQLALLLEVSGYPKPGNVHRTVDFEETRYEHFLASTVAVAPHFRHVAERGILARIGKIGLDKVGVGEAIKSAVVDVLSWQRGGNTSLGSTILLMPMAAAAGFTYAEDVSFNINKFRRNLIAIVRSTTAIDAVKVYDAITITHPGGLGKVPELDVTDTTSKRKIIDNNISLFDVFKISASWDSVSSEWVNNYHVTFDMGYPYLRQQLKETGDVNIATVHTFLKILSQVPDTLIARKVGMSKVKEISVLAQNVLEAGGLTTQKGLESLRRFDIELRDPTHKLNPGTTADMTAAVLAVHLLKGYRP
ncbi:MAG: triphosphoribosyl-dephospho-CoA synthase [Candidatus Bathyarchaeota archaeon]